MVTLSVPTQSKKVQGEKSGEWTYPWKLAFQTAMNVPIQGYLQFITHQESRSLIFPLLESTGWIARIQRRVFIKINWATQLFTVFSNCCSICPSPSLDMLFLLFSQYPAIPQCTRVHLFVIYGLIFLSSRKGGDLFSVQSRGRGFQEWRQQALGFSLLALPCLPVSAQSIPTLLFLN